MNPIPSFLQLLLSYAVRLLILAVVNVTQRFVTANQKLQPSTRRLIAAGLSWALVTILLLFLASCKHKATPATTAAPVTVGDTLNDRLTDQAEASQMALDALTTKSHTSEIGYEKSKQQYDSLRALLH